MRQEIKDNIRNIKRMKNIPYMNMHTIRENVIRVIFVEPFYDKEEMLEQIDLYIEYLDEILLKDMYSEFRELQLTDDEISNVYQFLESKIEDGEKYVVRKTKRILEKLPEIDKLIDEVSNSWRIGRIGKIELAIMRVAVYEIIYDENIPRKVAINEAVEFAKIYGNAEASSFINGILKNISK